MDKSNFDKLRATGYFIWAEYSRLEDDLSMQTRSAYHIFAAFLDLIEEMAKICIPEEALLIQAERDVLAVPHGECSKTWAFQHVSEILRSNVRCISDKVCLSVNLAHRDMPQRDLFMIIQNHGDNVGGVSVAEITTSLPNRQMSKDDFEEFIGQFLMSAAVMTVSNCEFELEKLDAIGLLPKRLSDLEKRDELYRTTGYGASLSSIALEAIANTTNGKLLAESVGMRLPHVA